MSIPFILDTDTAQDDCVAILLGVLDPVADLRAITMVAGNVGFDQQTENALMTLSVAGAPAPGTDYQLPPVSRGYRSRF